MKLTIGEHAGFCFGVRRAVLKAFECAEKQLPCVTLGPLIHNPQEVERLRRAGIRSVETPNRQRTGHLTAPASDTDILVNDRIAKTFFVLAHSYSIDRTNGCTCLAAAAICLTPGLKKARPKIRLGYFYRHSAPKSRRPPRR